jgi:isopenicillin-N N-acyltransferase-like protein
VQKTKAVLLKVITVLALLLLLTATWAVRVYHIGVFPTPILTAEELNATDADHARWISKSTWMDKSKIGINQLVLIGSDYERGWVAGHFTKDLLERQETELVTQLKTFFPHPVLIQALDVLLISWFWGIENYFAPFEVREMYGVSKFASPKFDYLADGFTRQIAYHGIHEVGQMMVDQGSEDMGCTVIAIKNPDSTWMVGRNFDFEGGRVFDSEKIMKWVFPNEGHAFVSVIWAGMVGAVTAVNDQGLYISLNAAGSTDLARYGTPSTLILLDAIQHSDTVEQALKTIETSPMFITDIFFVTDAKSNTSYRVEKSPKHTVIIPLTQSAVVTNHLIAPAWKNDRINEFRKNELTSLARSERGEQLIADFEKTKKPATAEDVLKILRDKGVDAKGQPLQLGNRRGIDALIATHSVIYDGKRGVLYVSQGPGVSGAFSSFDLKRSFQQKTPVATGMLGDDPLVPEHTFLDFRSSAKTIAQISRDIRKGKCEHLADLESMPTVARNNYEYHDALGDLFYCRGTQDLAKVEWQKALDLTPAYPRQVRKIQEKLSR